MENTHARKDDAPHKAGREKKNTQSHYADLSAPAQRKRLLDALHCGSVTTLEARCNLDILHPAMRVRELRLAGYDIRTIWIDADTGFGVKHRVARYILVAAPKGADHES